MNIFLLKQLLISKYRYICRTHDQMQKKIYLRKYKPPRIPLVVCVCGGFLLIKNTTDAKTIRKN